MRIRWRILACLCLGGLLVWFLADAGAVRDSVAEALALCARSVVPSLFPFLVASSALLALGFGELAAPWLAGLMEPLFRVPGAGSAALVLGLVGGYPIGAKTAADLYRENLVSREEAERLLAQSGFGSAAQGVTCSYVALGHVAAQTPLGGSEAAPGTKIGLDISSDSTNQPSQSNVTINQFKPLLDLQVGETFNLADTLQYSGSAGSIVWSSSDPSSVFVDVDGYVVAIAPGAATVTVVVGGEAASCYVTVNDSRPLEMAGSVILEVGEEFPLCQQLGDIDVSMVYWVSADPRVASVLWNGVVTGVAEGCTFVTALYAGQVKQCIVWVLDSDSYIKVKRFDQNTTQQDAEAALQAAGVEYTVKQVYNSPAAAGCVADFDFTGYSDSDYYYISGTRTPDLCISSGGGTTQQPAKEPAKEPAKQPEKEQPAGKASLSVVNRPSKTTYYIGDKLNTTGLSVRYTDTAGKTQTITSGFSTNADLSSAGSKQVTVTYQGVSTTFNVTVKTPSVTVTQEELNEGLRLYATTDPAGQDVTWSSSNPSVEIGRASCRERV